MVIINQKLDALKKELNQQILNKQLFRAVYDNDLESVKKAIKDGADVNAKDMCERSPLHCVAWRGYTELTPLLIEKGADVNATDEDGYTPLHYTAEFGKIDMVKLLIEAGANLNARDEEGNTPLTLACWEEHTEIANLLRQHGGVE